MKRILIVLLLILSGAVVSRANQSVTGWCESGAQVVVTAGINSTTQVRTAAPSCTVTVFVHGGGLAAIFSDNNNTVLSNPFTAQTNGQWIFYAANGRYDIQMSGGGLTSIVSYSDVLLSDPAGPMRFSAASGIWADVTQYGAKGDGTTDDTAAVNAAITACQALVNNSAASGATAVYFPPGRYSLTTPVTKKSCPWIGTFGGSSLTSRLVWRGSAGATVVTQSGDTGTASYGGFYYLGFGDPVDATVVKPATWVSLGASSNNFMDRLYSFEHIQFVGSTGDAVTIPAGWVNARFRTIRWDGIGGYCIRSTVAGPTGMSNFLVDDFEIDNTATTNVPGFFLFDNTSNVFTAGSAMLSNAKIELNAPFGAGGAVVVLTSPNASASQNWLALKFMNVSFAPGAGAPAASAVLVTSTSTQTTYSPASITLDNTHMNNINAVMTGTWKTPVIPVANSQVYQFAVYDASLTAGGSSPFWFGPESAASGGGRMLQIAGDSVVTETVSETLRRKTSLGTTLKADFGLGTGTQVQVNGFAGAAGSLDIFDQDSVTTPHKFLRVSGGSLQFLNSSFSSNLLTLDDSGNANFSGSSGNVAMNGSLSTKSIDSVQLCDQFAGATADAKITACIAALPSTGGTADARGLIGAQTVAVEIDVGNSTTKFVTLLLPCGATWNVTITGGVASAIKVFGGSGAFSTCAQNNAFQLKLAAAGNVASLLTNDQTCANCSIRIHGMMLYNTLGGTVANAMADFSNLGNNAEIEGVNIATFSGKGLWIHGINSESVFKAVNVDGGQTAGNVPCTIETTSTSLQTMRFYGLDCQHPGATKKVLVIDGHGAANLCCLSFFGSHFEGSNTDTTTPFVSVADAKNIAFYSPLFNSLDAGTTNYGVAISQTGAGLTEGITVMNATQANGNFINDTISSRTVSGGSSVLPFYQYSQNALVATSPMVLAKVDSTGNGADIGQTTLYAVPSTAPAGWYRLTCYIVLTRAATTSSTMPGCKAWWTDLDTNTVASPVITATSTANVVGTTNSSWLTTGQNTGIVSFYGKAGTNIQYGSNGYVSSGATSMQFALHVRLEYLGNQ